MKKRSNAAVCRKLIVLVRPLTGFMLAAILMNFSSPLKPSHILWINLITDSLPALALGVDPENPAHFMRQPPRPKNENLFASGGLSCTLLYGFLIAFISTAAFLCLFLFYQILLEICLL